MIILIISHIKINPRNIRLDIFINLKNIAIAILGKRRRYCILYSGSLIKNCAISLSLYLSTVQLTTCKDIGIVTPIKIPSNVAISDNF